MGELPIVRPEKSMVGGLKIVEVKAEHVAEFERLFAELRAEMHRHEPGCLLYSLLKSRVKPGVYIVHEQYRDQAALHFDEILIGDGALDYRTYLRELDRMPGDVGAVELKLVKDAGMDNVHFAFTGDPVLGKGHTYRVQGPSFVIEFLNVQADSGGNVANHIHSCWRRIKGDFGL